MPLSGTRTVRRLLLVAAPVIGVLAAPSYGGQVRLGVGDAISLDFPRTLPGGWLLVEHGYDQAEAVAALIAGAGFTERISLADLAGIPRVAGGKMGDS